MHRDTRPHPPTPNILKDHPLGDHTPSIHWETTTSYHIGRPHTLHFIENDCMVSSCLFSYCVLFYQIITVLSFTELVPKLSSISGVKVFLSEHLSQDPLEKFFGCQRQRGGTHDNPSVQAFCKNTQALRVINMFCRGPVKGNCRTLKPPVDLEKENVPLPKWRRK